MTACLPGGRIGIFGGGQLGRMSAIAARELGYGVRIFEPGADCPAGQVADGVVRARYTDTTQVEEFAKSVDVVTYEFENIPVEALLLAGKYAPIRPGPEVLRICQHREREKTFLRENGFPCAGFRIVTNVEELREATAELGFPCVLKTAEFGYDGKGQRKLNGAADVDSAWASLGVSRAVVEQWITHELELSVICARSLSGQTLCFPASENIHTHHILDVSIVPARVDPGLVRQAEGLAISLAEKLDVVGLIAVEMFLDHEGRLLVNELAPRPHNSGHYTIDACVTSQFEQHIRAVCGLPLGEPSLLGSAAMLNILGDAWSAGVPAWEKMLQIPRSKLHLYGKQEARPGRKMGHITFLGDDALNNAMQGREILGK